MTAIDDQRKILLVLNNHIRTVELELKAAKFRRKAANACLSASIIVPVALYVMLFLPWIPGTLKAAIGWPGLVASVIVVPIGITMKRNPGGPVRGEESTGSLAMGNLQGSMSSMFAKKDRMSEQGLELELAQLREQRKFLVASTELEINVRRVAYKEDAYAEIKILEEESKRYRSVNNALQGVLIIGSLAATGAAGIAAQLAPVRWAILGVTFVVGISSGFMGYFKYKERSFYLQQTADAIEAEWEAVEIGVGRYKNIENEEDRLAEFVEEVHRLKSEQKKRQQNLEQPPESRGANE